MNERVLTRKNSLLKQNDLDLKELKVEKSSCNGDFGFSKVVPSSLGVYRLIDLKLPRLLSFPPFLFILLKIYTYIHAHIYTLYTCIHTAMKRNLKNLNLFILIYCFLSCFLTNFYRLSSYIFLHMCNNIIFIVTF